MSAKTANLRARCSNDFKDEVLRFMRENYPEEDEAWIVRNAVKEFMAKHRQSALLNNSPTPQLQQIDQGTLKSHSKPVRKKVSFRKGRGAFLETVLEEMKPASETRRSPGK